MVKCTFPVQRGIEDGNGGIRHGLAFVLELSHAAYSLPQHATCTISSRLANKPRRFWCLGAKVLTMGVRSALDLNQTRKRRKP